MGKQISLVDITISEQKDEWGIVRSFVVEYVYLDKLCTQVFIALGLCIKNLRGTRGGKGIRNMTNSHLSIY